MYKHSHENWVTRLSDGARIATTEPNDNPDFIEYRAWVDAGGVALSADPLPALDAEQVLLMRRAAYEKEADPLKNEAEYDALIRSSEPDYTAWLAAVAAIKERFPLPQD